MLQDIERKVLRILVNHSKITGNMPSIKKLMIKTGRSEQGILAVLKVLEKERYIEWDPGIPDRIKVLEEWERKYVPWWSKIE